MAFISEYPLNGLLAEGMEDIKKIKLRHKINIVHSRLAAGRRRGRRCGGFAPVSALGNNN